LRLPRGVRRVSADDDDDRREVDGAAARRAGAARLCVGISFAADDASEELDVLVVDRPPGRRDSAAEVVPGTPIAFKTRTDDSADAAARGPAKEDAARMTRRSLAGSHASAADSRVAFEFSYARELRA